MTYKLRAKAQELIKTANWNFSSESGYISNGSGRTILKSITLTKMRLNTEIARVNLTYKNGEVIVTKQPLCN